MRWMKKFLVLMLMTMVFVTPVRAASVNNGMIAEQGLYVYVVPSGKSGIEDGNFWVYIEMMGEKNTPYMDSSWSVEMEIHHLESERVEKVENLSVSSKGTGYLLPALSLSGQFNYKDYEIIARIKEGENVLGEKKDVVADLIVPWPSLVENQWVEALGFGQEIGEKTRAVVFDWENDALFSRLFQVSAEESYDALLLENRDNVWTLQLTEELDGEVVFRLKDEAGHTQDCVYQIQVTKEGFPPAMKVMIVLALLIAAICTILIFLKRQADKPEKKNLAMEEEKNKITGFEVRITKAKEDLEDRRNQYQKKITEYKNFLLSQKHFLETNGAGVDVAKALENLDRLNEEGKLFSSQEDEYHAVIKEINEYGADYNRWNKDRESKSVDYDIFIRNLQEETENLARKERECAEKIKHLKQEVKDIQEKLEVLEAPLGMAIRIVIEKNRERYSIYVDSHDKGFVLDEQYPLNSRYRLMTEKVRTILGVETGISIASCKDKDYVLLESKGNRLMRGREVIHREKMEEGNVYEFAYFFDDESKVKISIDTN